MPDTKKIQVQDTVFDLATMEEVTLVKEFEYTPVESVQDALAKLGNDSAKLLSVINDGLVAEQRRLEKKNPDGWHTFTDENEINGEFKGIPADMKKVNALTLTLAKTVFGFNKDMEKSAKKAAKQSAQDMIRTTQAIRDGLQKSAALGVDDDE